MNTIVYTVVYLSGYIVAYLLLRRSAKKELGEWTIGLRRFSLVVSLFSWIMVVADVARMIFEAKQYDDETPAKW